MNSSHAHINLPPQKKKEPSVPVFFDVPSNSIAETRTGSGNDAAQGGIPATNATQQNSTCSTPRGFYILVLMGTFASLPFELLRKGYFQKKSNTQIQIEGEKLWNEGIYICNIFANTSICQSSLCVHHVLAELNVWKGTNTTRETRRCNCQPSLPKIKTSVEHVHTLASRKWSPFPSHHSIAMHCPWTHHICNTFPGCHTSSPQPGPPVHLPRPMGGGNCEGIELV